MEKSRTRIVITEDVINKVVESYSRLGKVALVSKETGVSYTSTKRILERTGNFKEVEPHFSKEEELKVCFLYNEGYNTEAIIKIMKNSGVSISPASVLRILKRVGGVKSVPRNNITVTSAMKKEIIDMYSKGFSTVDIASIFKGREYPINCDHTISNILKAEGVVVGGSGSEAIIDNVDFFENIDSELKAYLLGFFVADGNVCLNKENKKVVQMCLSAKDNSIIELFISSIGIRRKVKDFDNMTVSKELKKAVHYSKDSFKTGKYSKLTSFSVVSNKLFDDLGKLGVVPRKTGKELFPNIKEELKRHFIRGFFDGDGFAKKYSHGCGASFGFCGNYSMMESIQELLFDIGIPRKKITYNKSNHIYYVQRNRAEEVLKFYKHIYTDATYYLLRKKEKFDIKIKDTDNYICLDRW